MKKRENKPVITEEKTDLWVSNKIKSEYLVAFFAMALIILGAVVGEQLAPSRNVQTTTSSAEESIINTDINTESAVFPACTHFAIDDYSGVDSKLVSISPDFSGVSIIKSFPCIAGICAFKSLETDLNGDLITFANSNNEIYKINKANGNLTSLTKLSPDFNLTGLSFNPDGNLWAWVNGRGLYTVDLTTGETVEQKASSMQGIEDIAWDNGGVFLYMTKSPGNELYKFNPLDGSFVFVGILPGKTDALDFAPNDYSGGNLIGAYRNSSQGILYFYTYDVSVGSIIDKFTVKTNYSNLDALTVCSS